MASAPKAENSFFSKARATSGYYGHYAIENEFKANSTLIQAEDSNDL